jgi:phospholipase C
MANSGQPEQPDNVQNSVPWKEGWMKFVRSGLFALFLSAIVITASGCGAGAVSKGSAGPPQTSLQHVVVVIMQNASFDHLFGMYPAPTGASVEGLHPGVSGYTQADAAGNAVSPMLLTTLAPTALKEGRTIYLASIDGGLMDKYAFNNGDTAMGYYDGTIAGVGTLWNYAQQYAMADHFFSSVIGEAPTNQLHMIAASDGNFPYSVQPYYGPCAASDVAAKPLTFPNLGDQLTQKGVTWGVYMEQLGNCSESNGEHNPFQYFTSTYNHNLWDYSKFSSDVSGGTLPSVTFVIPDNTDDMHPGYGPLTNGINFLDTLIRTVQASAIWNSTAIIITFDDAGGWYDHVSPPQVDAEGLAPRVPLLVISPLAKKNYISHSQMDDESILLYIQKNWGLPPLNARNTQTNDLSDLFQ